METLNKENFAEFDIAITKAINDEYGKEVWSKEHAEFEVGTDKEADERHEEYLDSYIDDVLEIPEHIEMYFDRERWKGDARINSSRGNDLNSYDGLELEAEIDGETYYIYRTN